MENIVTRPVNMVRLGNQRPVFSFLEEGKIYMLTNLRVIDSDGYEKLQTVCMANGEVHGFGKDEYVEPVNVFTVHTNLSLARSERVVKG